MNKPSFCPECHIGLSTQEINLCHCQNCMAFWPTECESSTVCPECLEETDPEELGIFNGLCEDCSLDE